MQVSNLEAYWSRVFYLAERADTNAPASATVLKLVLTEELQQKTEYNEGWLVAPSVRVKSKGSRWEVGLSDNFLFMKERYVPAL